MTRTIEDRERLIARSITRLTRSNDDDMDCSRCTKNQRSKRTFRCWLSTTTVDVQGLAECPLSREKGE